MPGLAVAPQDFAAEAHVLQVVRVSQFGDGPPLQLRLAPSQQGSPGRIELDDMAVVVGDHEQIDAVLEEPDRGLGADSGRRGRRRGRSVRQDRGAHGRA